MIRIVLADDHNVVRTGLRRLLSQNPEIDIVGEAASGDEAIGIVRETPADVILLDITMPGPGFLAVLREIRALRPRLAVLVLSALPEDQYAVRALRAGAAGYLTKDCSFDELTEAIRRVVRGQRYVTAGVAESLISAVDADPDRPPHESLSDREYEVLRLAAAGRTVKEIAAELNLSPKTVSTYRRRILEKLGVSNQAEALRYALDHGLVD